MSVSWGHTIAECQAQPGRAVEALQNGTWTAPWPALPSRTLLILRLRKASLCPPALRWLILASPVLCLFPRNVSIDFSKPHGPSPGDEGSDPSRGSSAPDGFQDLCSSPRAPGMRPPATLSCPPSFPLSSPPSSLLFLPRTFMPTLKNQMQSSWFSFETDSSVRVSPSF